MSGDPSSEDLDALVAGARRAHGKHGRPSVESPSVRRAWIHFTYLAGDPRWRIFPAGALECWIFFDVGEGELLTDESLDRFIAYLGGKSTERQSRIGTGKRGRDKMLRPDGLLALHYHLLRHRAKQLLESAIAAGAERKTIRQLRAAALVYTECFHVACAWGLGKTRNGKERTAVVRRAQRIYRRKALELISRLADDEALGLLVRVNAMAVDFARR